jgi:periplasmic copper chaperone A
VQPRGHILWIIRNKTMKTMTCAAFAATFFAFTSFAHAHATLEKSEARAGTSYKAVLSVPHGCDGKATIAVSIKLPEGFISAQPMPKPGWKTETVKGDYQKSYTVHGKEVRSGVVEVRWTDGNLPDEFYDEFVVVGRLANFDKDTTLYFPATQTCASDASVTWTEIPAEGQNPHDLKGPAPELKVLAAAPMDEHAGHGAAKPEAVKAGSIEISSPFLRAMVPGAKVGGGFVKIENKGGEADRLVAASSPAAGRVEIHEMTMEGDVMKMRQLKDGIEVPAGKTVMLKPGGLHLMFMDVAKPFKEGETVPVTLEFQKAGKVDVTFKVGPAAASSTEHQH